MFGVCSNICVIYEDNPDHVVLSKMTKRKVDNAHEVYLDKANVIVTYYIKTEIDETTRDLNGVIFSS